MRFLSYSAYTLVELLIALVLSLFLLLGVAELFQRVGGSMNEARSIINMSAQLNEAAMLLRQDLSRISKDLAAKPKNLAEYIADGNVEAPEDNGYLEIIEGPGHLYNPDCPLNSAPDHQCHPYVDINSLPDQTVGDVDDIIAFTVLNRTMPFRGVIREKIVERESAEVVWFVRGNTLYRRERLIDDVTARANDHHKVVGADDKDFPTKKDLDDHGEPTEAGYAIVSADETNDGREQRYDAVQYGEDDWRWRTLLTSQDLSLRARRFGHDGLSPNEFPHPLYDTPYENWRYLRMPIIEESDYWSGEGIQHWKNDSVAILPPAPENLHPDLWEQPYFFPGLQKRKNNGSIIADNSHKTRAGEDAVLANVLSFDVKVWCPVTKEFVDLGVDDTAWAHGNNNHQDKLPGVWDSWTQKYENESKPLPPYTEPLEAIQITIRCFEPASRIIKQVTVVHRFKDSSD